MLRLSTILIVCFCLPALLRAENVGDIVDPSTPGPNASNTKDSTVTKAPEAPLASGPSGQSPRVIDEPGFKASVKYADRPTPNYDQGTKNNNLIAVPKMQSKPWTVPIEEGYTPPSNAVPGADAGVPSAEKSVAATETISPTLAAAIAKEKGGTRAADMVPIYKAIVDAEKDNAAPHYRLGLARVHSGELQNGLVELETAISLQPKNPKYLCDYGILALRAGWVEKAFAACQAAVTVAPNVARYHSALGDVHLAAEHLPEAVNAYTRAVKLDPDNSVYFYNLGLVYMHGRDFKHAVELFTEAARLKPTSAYFASRGLACENLKLQKRAIEDYQMAIKLDKNNAYAHYLYASVFSDPNDPTFTDRYEAVEHAEIAVKLSNRKNALYLMGLARALKIARKYEKAADAAKAAVELEPARSDYRKELADIEASKMTGSVDFK